VPGGTPAAGGLVNSGEIFGADPLRHHHAPGVGDQLAHFVGVDRGQVHLDPLVAHFRGDGHEELLRLGRDQRGPFLPREAAAHGQLVAAQRHVDDPADPELHPVPDEGFLGPWQPHGHPPDLLDGDRGARAGHGSHPGGVIGGPGQPEFADLHAAQNRVPDHFRLLARPSSPD
jgi:hypothetical protein